MNPDKFRCPLCMDTKPHEHAPTASAPDRSGCKPWCGTEREGSDETWGHVRASVTSTRWCSYACRERDYPPIAPAKHVERRHAYASYPYPWTARCGYESAAPDASGQITGRVGHESHCSKCKVAPEAPKAEAHTLHCKMHGGRCVCAETAHPATAATAATAAVCQRCKQPWRAGHLCSESAKPAKADACGRYQRHDEWSECYVCDLPESAHSKPAKADKEPVCCSYSKVAGERHVECDGAGVRRWRGRYEVTMCDAHMLNFEAALNTDGVTNVLDPMNTKYPERLSRPAMAHASQWPEESEDVR